MKLKTVFRYPGGKTKISSGIVNEILENKPSKFIDVFVGGGSIFIGVMNSGLCKNIVINDIDKYIYSFWSMICSGKYKKINSMIDEYGEPSIKTFKHLRRVKDDSEEIMGFKALFFSRTAFSGIFRSGPIGGYEQKGAYKIGCRYNIEKLKSNIESLGRHINKINIKCFQKDFMEIIEDHKDDSDAVLYLDPPYMKQGNQLYNVHLKEKDYKDMKDILAVAKCKWIISHDNYEPFVKLFKGWANITSIDGVSYTINSIEHNRKSELLISNQNFSHIKRSVGRPRLYYGIPKYLKCSVCKEDKKTNPQQFKKQVEKSCLKSKKFIDIYVCRSCRKKASLKLTCETL